MWRSSRPHIPKIGQIPGTRHYRNIRRHNVLCSKEVLSLRIDESLWFSNVRAVEDVIQRTVAERSQVRQVVLNFAALNGVDTCALESLELVIHRLADQGIDLHLSKVKGPVMDRLATSSFLSHLTGRVFLSHYEAMEALAPDVTNNADRSDRPMIDPSQPSPECGPATG